MNAAQWLAKEWARQIGPALSSMTGEPYEAAAPPAGGTAPSGPELRVVRRLREMPKAEISLSVSEEVWRQCGSAVLRSAGIADATEEEVRNAFLEVVEQSLGQLAAVLGRLLGREVSWEPGGDAQAESGPNAWAPVELKGPGGVIGLAWVAASGDFPSAGPGGSVEAGGEHAAAADGSADRRPMLELLMEVELPVGVTFGRTQLKLKDAIKLTSGSIVELNRSIIEPVEVIVNNCVIARGEVVVIEGNYGVRIQEIVSREERLRTLF